MSETRNLCAQIPTALHNKVSEEKARSGKTLNQYITDLLVEYYRNQNGGKNMEKTRTLAFQIPEEMFQRIKAHLDRESTRTGKKLTQRQFVLGLIEEALERAESAETEHTTESVEPEIAADADENEVEDKMVGTENEASETPYTQE